MLYFSDAGWVRSDMEDDRFMRYVETHSQTERALFTLKDVARFYSIVGNDRAADYIKHSPMYENGLTPLHYQQIKLELVEYFKQEEKEKSQVTNATIFHVDFIQQKLIRKR